MMTCPGRAHKEGFAGYCAKHDWGQELSFLGPWLEGQGGWQGGLHRAARAALHVGMRCPGCLAKPQRKWRPWWLMHAGASPGPAAGAFAKEVQAGWVPQAGQANAAFLEAAQQDREAIRQARDLQKRQKVGAGAWRRSACWRGDACCG